MKAACLVTIILPTRNRRESLRKTLAALAQQDFPGGSFEVVVAADGCTDGTSQFLQGSQAEWPFSLRWVELNQSGPATARNRAIAEARGEIIVFVDDDVVPARTWLSRHVAQHTRDSAAVVIGPLSPGSKRRATWVRWEDDRLQRQYRAMQDGVYGPTPRQFYTGNSSVRRQWIDRAGGFNERLRRGEDVELAFRLLQLGMRFYFDPQADALHHSVRSYQSWRVIPAQYARNDVTLARELGQMGFLSSIGREFHERRQSTQWLARFCLGPLPFAMPMLFLLGAIAVTADRISLDYIGKAACSGVWNLAYWQGLTKALGGRGNFWRLIDTETPEVVCQQISSNKPISDHINQRRQSDRTSADVLGHSLQLLGKEGPGND
jgi:glycosyltransferase involved in cell wall biosynthesis